VGCLFHLFKVLPLKIMLPSYHKKATW
jgi:hypothetical protein